MKQKNLENNIKEFKSNLLQITLLDGANIHLTSYQITIKIKDQ